MWLPSLYNCFSIWNKDLKQFMKMKLLYLAYYISKYFYHATSKIFNRRNNMSRKCAVIKLRSVWRLKIIQIEHNSNACRTKIDPLEQELLIFLIYLTRDLKVKAKMPLKRFVSWYCNHIWFLSCKASIFENIIHGFFGPLTLQKVLYWVNL